jgi:serine/threonine protein kinase
MSPQLLEKKFYTSKCDIWALGILLYELLYNSSPFPAKNLK